jgi:hypothetical protein
MTVEGVTASSASLRAQAKQSISPRKERMDCFASLAMTARDTCANSYAIFKQLNRQKPAFPRRDASEFCHRRDPRKIEGAGKRRVPAAPAASCARVEGRKHTSIQVHRNTRHSLRSGFNGLYRALPGDRPLLPPSSANQRIRPGRAIAPVANLTPGSGRQDHTALPSAGCTVRLARYRSLTENPPCDLWCARCNRVHRIPPQRS